MRLSAAQTRALKLLSAHEFVRISNRTDPSVPVIHWGTADGLCRVDLAGLCLARDRSWLVSLSPAGRRVLKEETERAAMTLSETKRRKAMGEPELDSERIVLEGDGPYRIVRLRWVKTREPQCYYANEEREFVFWYGEWAEVEDMGTFESPEKASEFMREPVVAGQGDNQ